MNNTFQPVRTMLLAASVSATAGQAIAFDLVAERASSYDFVPFSLTDSVVEANDLCWPACMPVVYASPIANLVLESRGTADITSAPQPKHLMLDADDWIMLPTGALAIIGMYGELYLYDDNTLINLGDQPGELENATVSENVRYLSLTNANGDVISPYAEQVGNLTFGDAEANEGADEKPGQEGSGSKETAGSTLNTILDWIDALIVQPITGTSPKTIKECVDIAEDVAPDQAAKKKIYEQIADETTKKTHTTPTCGTTCDHTSLYYKFWKALGMACPKDTGP